jgi:hypothetical protein
MITKISLELHYKRSNHRRTTIGQRREVKNMPKSHLCSKIAIGAMMSQLKLMSQRERSYVFPNCVRKDRGQQNIS